VTTDTLSSYF